MRYVVELEPHVWLINGRNLERTVVLSHAKRFPTKAVAEKHLSMAREHRPFAGAKLYMSPSII